MSNKEIIDGVELEDQNIETADKVIEVDVVSEDESKAREKGWTDLDEWLESGKDKKDWVTAKHYNERGEWINERRSHQQKQSEFEQRLSDNNKIWQATLDKRIEELNNKRDDLIELADKDGVKEIDKEINTLEKEKAKNQPPSPTQEDIDVENEYFATLDTRAKKALAQQVGSELSQKGLKGQALVDAVRAEVDAEFPRTNPNREKPGVTDKSKPAAGGAKSVSSISQLKGEDKIIAEDLIDQGIPEKRVLQMINDREK